jgi:hypothetical protein
MWHQLPIHHLACGLYEYVIELVPLLKQRLQRLQEAVETASNTLLVGCRSREDQGRHSL